MTFNAVTDPSIVAYRWDLDDNGSYGDDNRAAGSPHLPGREDLRDRAGDRRRPGRRQPAAEGRHRRRGPETPTSPPEASFVFFPAGPVAGELVTFVSTSTDSDSPIPASALDWDLNGDGVFDDAAGPSATTSYPVAGTYTISLRITTNKTDVATLVLNVGAPGHPRDRCRATRALSDEPVPGRADRRAGTRGRGARIRRLTIDAPPGTGVKVRCGGRGCPFKRAAAAPSPLRVRANRELPPRRLLRIRTPGGPAAAARRQAETVRHASRRGREVHALRDPPAQVPHPRRHVPGARERPPAHLPVAVIDPSRG